MSSSNSLKITRFYGDKERKDKQAELKQAELNAQQDYKASLSDLKGNSKPLINTLSIVAGENRKFGKAITETIENHLLKVGLLDCHLLILSLLLMIAPSFSRVHLKYNEGLLKSNAIVTKIPPCFKN